MIFLFAFDLDFSKIHSPFLKENFKYELVSIIDNSARIKVINESKAVYIFVKKGKKLGECKVVEIKNTFLKLQCAKKYKYLKLKDKKLFCIKEKN